MGQKEVPLRRRTIGIAGAGAMGIGIAEVALASDYDVVLYNHNRTTLGAAFSILSANFAKRISKGTLTVVERDFYLERLKLTDDLTDLGVSDLIIETIVEDYEKKSYLFVALENSVGDDVIIASNTSSLSIEQMSSLFRNRERFLGLHFFNPVPLMRLTEIIPSHATTAEVVNKCLSIVKSFRKIPVICKATPGFIVNRMARPFYTEAFRLLDEGSVQASIIDDAMRRSGQFKMGPLELTDLIGQDVNLATTTGIWKSMGFDSKFTPSLFQTSLVESGRLGRKSSRGVFSYDGSNGRNPTEVGKAVDEPVIRPVTVYGDIGILAPLIDAVSVRKENAVRYESASSRHGVGIGIEDGPLIKLTNGQPAYEIAAHLKRDVILLDLALNYKSLPYILACVNPDLTDLNRQLAVNFLQHSIGVVQFVDDTPGIVVARIVSCLINEALTLTEQKTCDRADIERAAKYGVNYPIGLVEWMELLGPDWVAAVLQNLGRLLHPTRYRAARSLLSLCSRSEARELSSSPGELSPLQSVLDAGLAFDRAETSEG